MSIKAPFSGRKTNDLDARIKMEAARLKQEQDAATYASSLANPVEQKETNLGIGNSEKMSWQEVDLNNNEEVLNAPSIESRNAEIINADNPTDAIVKQIIDAGGVLPDTGASTEFSNDEGVVREKAEEERVFQIENADKTGNQFSERVDSEGNKEFEFFNVLDTAPKYEGDMDSVDRLNWNIQKVRNNKAAASSQDTLSSFIARGEIHRTGFQELITPLMQDQTPLGLQVQTVLRQTGIVDENGSVTTIAANAMTATILSAIKNVVNKEDLRITKAERVYSAGEMSRENLESATATRQNLSEEKIDPNDIINGLGAGVINRLRSDPDELASGIISGFGGAAKKVDENVLSTLNTLIYALMQREGMFNKIEGEENILISADGAVMFENMREILDDLDIRDLTLRSKIPVLYPGEERKAGFRKKGDVSQSNKMSKNVSVEQMVKNTLASIPMTIIPERYEMARLLVESIIISDDGVNVRGFKGEVEGGRRYSGSLAAKTLGLDEAKWRAAYANARKNMADDQAALTANLVMIREAKKILKLMRFAAEEVGGVYYNKQFHASSVGRFFIRNTDINPQLSKLARMFVGNANTVVINPKIDKGQDIWADWSYIIGKNLLPLHLNGRGQSLTSGVRTEDMGWNAIQKPAMEILNNPNHEVYQQWVGVGKKISEVGIEVIQGNRDLNALKQGLGDKIFNDIFDSEGSGNSGDWGYPFQSYLDVYEMDNARKNGSSFKPKAQVQHDGKQNGIAIQAMQFGRRTILRSVGVMYSDENDVIPFGDIRDRFLLKMAMGIKVAFLHDLPRQAYWEQVLARIGDSKRQKEIGKDISKTPLMETSYGKYEGFNEETAINFIEKYSKASPDGEMLLEGKPEGLGIYSLDDQIIDLNDIITETLREVLNLRSQQIMKTAGEMWSMLGTDVVLKGPLGTDIYMGSMERKTVKDDATGEVIELPINILGETVNIPLTRMESTGSARSRNRKMIRDPKAKNGWRLEEQTKFGQEVANQLPVLTIQQIDAAVMAKTIKEVNEDRVQIGKPPKFVIPIHDAIITDATSVKDYHATINRQFRQVNNEYSVTKAIREGLENSRSNAIYELNKNPNKLIRMDDDSKYRAIHDALGRLYKKEILKQKLRKDSDEEKMAGLRKKTNLSQKDPYKIVSFAMKEGWKPDGSGSMTQTNIGYLITLFFQGNGIIERLKEEEKQATASRNSIYNYILRKILYQYN